MKSINKITLIIISALISLHFFCCKRNYILTEYIAVEFEPYANLEEKERIVAEIDGYVNGYFKKGSYISKTTNRQLAIKYKHRGEYKMNVDKNEIEINKALYKIVFRDEKSEKEVRTIVKTLKSNPLVKEVHLIGVK